MKYRIGFAILFLLTPNIANASTTVAGVTPCTFEGTERDSGGSHFVCSHNQKNQLTWMLARKLPNGGNQVLQSQTAQVSKSSKSSIQNKVIINVQSAAKSIPATVPNTDIPWPKPTSTISYPGIAANQHADDLFGLKTMHQQGITGAGYSVAFIDSPIISSHPAFASTKVICVASINGGSDGVVSCPPNYSGFSHGQGVAGTIGGNFGVAPGVQLISILTNSGDSINQGLNWVAQNYKKYNIVAVSVSIGATPAQRSGADIVCGVLNPAGFHDVLTTLSNMDVAVLFSTANQATIDWVREPNCLPGVISVAAVSSTNPQLIAPYSSISPDVDLLAPADFYSTGSNNDEVQFGGTSQATPFAAAIFALGKQARPDANIAQIFYYMKQTAAPVDDYYVKGLPIVRPVEMVKALKDAIKLPDIQFVRQIQVKSGG